MDAARVLREGRLRAGLTQREVAERAGVPQSVVARIENRGRVPKVDTLDRLLGPCGLALSAEPRIGLAVDREPIRTLLAIPPVARIRKLHDEVPRFRPLRILQVLSGRAVRFVLIGAVAERAHGAPPLTDAVEICVARERHNAERLAGAVRLFRRWRFPTGIVRWRWTVPRPVSYPELEGTASEIPVGPRWVRVATLENLIRIRRARGWRRDVERIEFLGAVREEAGLLALRKRRPAY